MSSLKITGPAKEKKRPLRIGAEILRDLPGILRARIEMPLGVLISVTDVVVNDDLSMAKIYFSVLGEHEAQTGNSLAKLLNEKKGVMRHDLAQRLVMRQHPDIRFYYDPTPARAARIEELLKQVRDLPSGTGEGGE